MDRNVYCRDCDRSIWGDKSCDVNVEDNGYFNLAGEKCYCKIVNGVRAEKYPWEERVMTTMSESVFIFIKKPKNCDECPCSYFTEGISRDYCQLKNYIDGSRADLETYTIPDWCPLKAIKLTV